MTGVSETRVALVMIDAGFHAYVCEHLLCVDKRWQAWLVALMIVRFVGFRT